LGCYPSEADSEEKHYIEDHAIVQQTIKANNEEVLLNWHIEHAQYDNPMTLGVWIMEVFKTDKKNGNTVFVDVTKLYQNLPQEDRDFLKNSTAEFPLDMFSITTPIEDDPFIQNNILSGPFIREH
jgi:alpha-ketoglutarate-dependent taurine dioxygenase